MKNFSDDLLDFIWDSPSPHHAVDRMLRDFGAKVVDEKTTWEQLDANFAVVRGGSVALLRLPKEPLDPQRLKFHIVAAHTDSPCLKLKPQPRQNTLAHCRQWGAEIYGGVLLNSWLDRDLGVAGRCHWWDEQREQKRLVRFDDWAWRVPQLAIHLDREVNKSLCLNPQTHMVPITGLDEGDSWMDALLKELDLKEKPKGFQFDLSLYDLQKPSYGGQHKEFLYAPRMDNLAMCHAGLQALLQAKPPENTVSILCCFHHEEVGSCSTEGAGSSFLPDLLERLSLKAGANREQYLASLQRSYMISADMAHALHPNYPDRHEPDHQPLLGKGPVLKGNVNLRYAGSASSHSRFLSWAEAEGIDTQDFVCRTDMGCGSTIGPTVAARLGITAIDVGNPMLSMHSCREMAASVDHEAMIKIMARFLSTS